MRKKWGVKRGGREESPLKFGWVEAVRPSDRSHADTISPFRHLYTTHKAEWTNSQMLYHPLS